MKNPSRKGNAIKIDQGDSVWCVFDKDNNTDQQLSEAKQLAQKHKFNIAFSNPCFEIWFYCHYENSTAHISCCGELLKKLKNIDQLKCYNKNSPPSYKDLKNDQETAITNAERLVQFHKSEKHEIISALSNPSTQIYLLVTYLLAL